MKVKNHLKDVKLVSTFDPTAALGPGIIDWGKPWVQPWILSPSREAIDTIFTVFGLTEQGIKLTTYQRLRTDTPPLGHCADSLSKLCFSVYITQLNWNKNVNKTKRLLVTSTGTVYCSVSILHLTLDKSTPLDISWQRDQSRFPIRSWFIYPLAIELKEAASLPSKV